MSVSSAISKWETLFFFDDRLVKGGASDVAGLLANTVANKGIFRFRINPSLLRVTKGKVSSLVLTKAGFERSNLGNQLTTLAYEGTTGYLRIDPTFVNAGLDDQRLSVIYQKFRLFERFYDSLDGDIWMVYKLRIYNGQLTQFEYTENAHDPWHIPYSFRFEAHTDLPYGDDRLGKAIVDLATPSSVASGLGVPVIGDVAEQVLRLL